MKRKFTDYSDRTFDCIAYRYAYWAKDTHMCRMLEKYMDKDTKALMLKLIYNAETGKEIELHYEQDGINKHSAHFDLTPLKQALQTYLVTWKQDNLNKISTENRRPHAIA